LPNVKGQWWLLAIHWTRLLCDFILFLGGKNARDIL
jgi:hypothetical protein